MHKAVSSNYLEHLGSVSSLSEVLELQKSMLQNLWLHYLLPKVLIGTAHPMSVFLEPACNTDKLSGKLQQKLDVDIFTVEQKDFKWSADLILLEIFSILIH